MRRPRASPDRPRSGYPEDDDAFNEQVAALNDDDRRYLAIGQRIRDDVERVAGDRLDEASAGRA